MSPEYIFVYGSLRRDFVSPARTVLDDYAEFVGEAVFRGKLYKIDWYPGVVESSNPDDVVHGEVYRMIDKEIVLEKLDQYEGCSPGDLKPHEFVRKEKRVTLVNGEDISAWIYLYDFVVSEKERIHSGDYADYSVNK